MLGHTKTVLVLLGGWAFLGDSISAKQLVGIIIAILGMVLYGIATRCGHCERALAVLLDVTLTPTCA